MRARLQWIAILALLAGSWIAPPLAQAAFMDAWADVVFGQPDFTHKVTNNGGLGRASLNNPERVALDALGNLYVADTSNQRALAYRSFPFGLSLPLVRRN